MGNLAERRAGNSAGNMQDLRHISGLGKFMTRKINVLHGILMGFA